MFCLGNPASMDLSLISSFFSCRAPSVPVTVDTGTAEATYTVTEKKQSCTGGCIVE